MSESGPESQQEKQAREVARAHSADLQEMAQQLSSLAESYGVCVIGYIWGGKDAPVFIRFSNVTERGKDIKRLLDTLYEMESKGAEEGRVQSIPVLKAFQA
jgi:hypothetical protein